MTRLRKTTNIARCPFLLIIICTSYSVEVFVSLLVITCVARLLDFVVDFIINKVMLIGLN